MKGEPTAEDLKVEVETLAADRHLPDTITARLGAMAPKDVWALLGMARRLPLRTAQIIAMLDLAEEIAVRENTSIEAVLAVSSLERIVHGPGSGPQRARDLLAALRARRYPGLTATRKGLEHLVAQMRLPSGIRVLLPTDLGSDELTIRLAVRSADDLDNLLDELVKKRSELRRIATILGGGNV